MNSTTPIHTPAVLDALPAGTEVRDADGDSGIKTRDGGWKVVGFGWALDPDWFRFPVHLVSPTAATAELVADLAGPQTPHDLKAEIRSILSEVRQLWDKQEADLDKLRDEDGDVASKDFGEWDSLRYDAHPEQDSEMLGTVVSRMEKLLAPSGGA
ncbi:hypothetical protein [Streptomyces sp. SID10815]|uniref:hypothetical protein n=1 Tax=Streptomyces sp. SID10815 TaxID=2706027 RepID=UPI0013C9F749|nr:hypothetical protein [Streptomyces sp. SID10815]NEA50424.1 hypothetical protein [Streptomyces sp. SID10815]